MNPFKLPSSSAAADWLMFGAILLAVGLGIAGFVVWFFVLRKTAKRRRKHRHGRHHRKLNPTLAQTGGLPPLREPDQPPRGV